ncbi:MAG TPA: hypothetical protein VHB77_16120 [Planctomycetaceae bacterium]|nr:hypothetical protein [Planctomycetaceae bacterium]
MPRTPPPSGIATQGVTTRHMETTERSLRAGDRVRIVTGGPTMAVCSIQWNVVRCVVTVDGVDHFAYFLPWLLVIAREK